MSAFVYGILLFVIAVGVHFLIWRMRPPKNHAKALLEIFLGIFGIGSILLWLYPGCISVFSIMFSRIAAEYLQFAFLYLSLAVAYIANYPSIEVDSPSLAMMMSIAEAGSDGLGKQEFDKKMSNDVLVVPRIYDLVTGKMAYVSDKKYYLTVYGKFIARIFTTYRKIIRETEKGG